VDCWQRCTSVRLAQAQGIPFIHSNWNTTRELRKRDELRISGESVCPDVILLETLFHEHPSRFVEVDASCFHESLHLTLPSLIQAGARVTFHDIAGEVEIVRCEARFDVAHECSWEGRVRYILDAVREVGHPAEACQVECWWKCQEVHRREHLCGDLPVPSTIAKREIVYRTYMSRVKECFDRNLGDAVNIAISNLGYSLSTMIRRGMRDGVEGRLTEDPRRTPAEAEAWQLNWR
jgi:hypothetical protein